MAACPRPIYAKGSPPCEAHGPAEARYPLLISQPPLAMERGARTGRRGSAPCCRTAATAASGFGTAPATESDPQPAGRPTAPAGGSTAPLGDPQPPPGDPQSRWETHSPRRETHSPRRGIHSPAGRPTAPAGGSTVPLGDPQPPPGDPQPRWETHSPRRGIHSPAGRPTAPAGRPTAPAGESTAPAGTPTAPAGTPTAPLGDPQPPPGDPQPPPGNPQPPPGHPQPPPGHPQPRWETHSPRRETHSPRRETHSPRRETHRPQPGTETRCLTDTPGQRGAPPGSPGPCRGHSRRPQRCCSSLRPRRLRRLRHPPAGSENPETSTRESPVAGEASPRLGEARREPPLRLAPHPMPLRAGLGANSAHGAQRPAAAGSAPRPALPRQQLAVSLRAPPDTARSPGGDPGPGSGHKGG
ncbi:proline-rich protein 2-like [Hirundo rustica]|uniref:proline-rich protein 2-like n=1 Tax=Hirundo rustica TaxID=43150 RepID=UPI001A948759|nr:proline-rich protein 2-like [Hirundo rustica]